MDCQDDCLHHHAPWKFWLHEGELAISASSKITIKLLVVKWLTKLLNESEALG